ncbi:MAG: phosphate ABC transporter permease family protein, partial [Boseongicola sp.]
MTTFAFAVLITACLVGYLLNRRAALAIRNSGTRLSSLVNYHGLFAALSVLVPVLFLLLIWLALQGPVVEHLTMRNLPSGVLDGLGKGEQQLILAEIQSISPGRIFGSPEEWKLAAAEAFSVRHNIGNYLLVSATIALSVVILIATRLKVAANFRAR